LSVSTELLSQDRPFLWWAGCYSENI